VLKVEEVAIAPFTGATSALNAVMPVAALIPEAKEYNIAKK
jgi:hypothetical protein